MMINGNIQALSKTTKQLQDYAKPPTTAEQFSDKPSAPGELNIQIKLLREATPILFTWWNRETNSAEGCLVACPGCQELDLAAQEPRSAKRRKGEWDDPPPAVCGSWSLELGEAISRAEIVTIPVEAESHSILHDVATDDDFPADEALETTGVKQCGKRANVDRTSQRRKKSKKSQRDGVEKMDKRAGDGVDICVGKPCLDEVDDVECGGSRSIVSSKDDKHVTVSMEAVASGGPHGGETSQGSKPQECKDPSSDRTDTVISQEQRGSDATAQDGRGMDDGTGRHVREKLGPVDRERCGEDASNSEGDVRTHKGGVGRFHVGEGGEHSQERMSDEAAETDLSIVHDMHRIDQGEEVLGGGEEVGGCGETVEHQDDITGSDSVGDKPDIPDYAQTSHNSQSLVQQISSSSLVASDVLGGGMTTVDSLPSDSVVVLQEGQDLAASEVDKALFEVLKGLIHPQTQNQAPPEEMAEAGPGSHRGEGSHLEEEDEVRPPTSSVDPNHAINTPAMVRYREHQRELYLKKLHRTSEGAGGNQVTICEVCGAILSITQIRKHMKYMHSPAVREKKHQCSTCEKRFSKADSMVRHQRTHFEPTFHCSRCEKSFRHNFQLQNHERQHAGHKPPKRIKKPRYKTANPKPRKLAGDLDSPDKEGVAECTVCGSRLGAKSLMRHMKMRHPGVPFGFFGCDDCQEKFTTKSKLHAHSLTHKGLEFLCGFCGLVLPEDLERVRHERSHIGVDVRDQGGVKFKCGFCEKTYSRVRDRLRHEMAHFDPSIDLSHGVRDRSSHVNEPVQCPLCHKTLKQNSMRSHMDSHSGRTWTCEVCGKTMSKGARYDHVKRHSSVKEHSCKFCDASFHTKHALIAHVRKHTQEKPVPCRFCDRKFARYEGRNNHEREHTGERPYQCRGCQKSWRDRSTYTQHMKKHHPGEPLMARKRPGPAILPQLPGVPAT